MDRFNDDDRATILPQFPGDPTPQVSDIRPFAFMGGGRDLVHHAESDQPGVRWHHYTVFDAPVNFAPTAPNIFTTSLISNPLRTSADRAEP